MAWRRIYLLIIRGGSRWLRVWIGIEGMLLVAAPIILTKQDRRNRERTIKYFIVQAASGGIVLAGVILSWTSVLGRGLVLKLGLWPAYYWVINVFRGISWYGIWWVGGVMKLPGWVFIDLCQWVWRLAVLSVVVGCVGGVYVANLKKLFAWSRVNHTGWISVMTRLSVGWTRYFFIYLVLIGRLLYIFDEWEGIRVGQIRLISGVEVAILTIPLLSLAGIPPLAGFYLKWVAVWRLSHTILVLTIPLIVGLAARIFYYLQISVWRLIRVQNKPGTWIRLRLIRVALMNGMGLLVLRLNIYEL